MKLLYPAICDRCGAKNADETVHPFVEEWHEVRNTFAKDGKAVAHESWLCHVCARTFGEFLTDYQGAPDGA